MRIWHYKLVPYLPNSQLLAQWRELNSIYKKQDKHILINYIYEYGKIDLLKYSNLVLAEMGCRGYYVKSLENYNNYFGSYLKYDTNGYIPFVKHHNTSYLIQCYYNLQEKYDRGQKDFDRETYCKLEKFMEEVILNA